MKPHPTPSHHRVQRLRDEDGRIVCFSCSHVFDEGYTGTSITGRSIPLAAYVVNQIVQHVPEPIAEMDDDEFATVRGLA